MVLKLKCNTILYSFKDQFLFLRSNLSLSLSLFLSLLFLPLLCDYQNISSKVFAVFKDKSCSNTAITDPKTYMWNVASYLLTTTLMNKGNLFKPVDYVLYFIYGASFVRLRCVHTHMIRCPSITLNAVYLITKL